MERIDFKKENIPFTQVANGVLYDRELSLGAKAIYAFMYSKPDGWQFSAQRIGNELGVSKPTVLNYLSELKDKGYLICQRLTDGRMLYKVVFPPIEPQSNNLTMANGPQSKKATVKKCHGEESLPVSNTDIKVIKKDQSNTSETIVPHDKIVGIIDLFKDVNPTNYKKWYSNKTQRLAISNLITLYGLEVVESVVKILPKSNKMPYMPTIVTPTQMETKWDSLRSSLEKKKDQIISKRPKVAFI